MTAARSLLRPSFQVAGRLCSSRGCVAGTVGRVFVAWTEATDKGVQVMLSRGRKGNKSTISASAAAKSKAVRATRPASAEVEHPHQH
jgi:hypothetical protein